MRRVIAAILLILGVGAVAWGQRREDHEDAKTDPQMAELFDGKQLVGWEVDGEHTIKDGTLIIGGKAAAKLWPKTPMGNKFKLLLEAEYHGERPQWIVQIHGSAAPIAKVWMMSADQFHEIVVINDLDSASWKHEVRVSNIGPTNQGAGFAGIGLGGVVGLEIGVPAGARLSIRRLRWYNAAPPPEPTSTGLWVAMTVLGLVVVGIMALGWFINRKRPAHAEADGS